MGTCAVILINYTLVAFFFTRKANMCRFFVTENMCSNLSVHQHVYITKIANMCVNCGI